MISFLGCVLGCALPLGNKFLKTFLEKYKVFKTQICTKSPVSSKTFKANCKHRMYFIVK
jgi:hypothetical protein